MPLYNYICHTCEKRLLRKLKRDKRETWTTDEFEELVLFETSHSCSPSQKELTEAKTCPRCDGTDCEKTFYGCNIIGYIRGNGFLDKDGCRRDMNLHTLTTDDPYAAYRQPGEVDDMKTKLKRSGQHDPKPKHFVASDMTKAVKKAVSSN